MKKFLLLLLFISALSAKGQTLVDTNKVWYNYIYDFWTNTEAKVFHKFSGDTTLASQSYKKLYVTNDSLLSNWVYGFAVREDLSKKVYDVWDGDTTEHLIYDFNLAVGDTFFTCGHFPIIVKTIDSVILLNGEYRKRYLFDQGPEEWIEGIGSTLGFLIDGGYNYCPSTGGINFLTCFAENNILKYHNPFYNIPCPFIVLNNSEIEKHIDNLILSPNPFHTTATLKISDLKNTNYNLKIFDVMGRLVRQNSLSFGKGRGEASINRDGLPDGLYFYELRTMSYELKGSGKFVVE